MAYTKQTWTSTVTPMDKSHMDYIEDGILNCVDADAVVAAASALVANKLAGADTQYAFRILGDGTISWGVGGTTALDTILYRLSAGILKTDGGIAAAGNLFADHNGTGNKIFFGSAADTNLYRWGANALATDDGFIVNHDPGTAFETDLWVYQGAGVGLKKVLIGVADSGGAGYRLLRVNN